jgi:hypothetical protein
MADRDYVFYRRIQEFPEEQVYVISGRACAMNNPYKSEVKGIVRVDEFVSTVVARSIGENKVEILCTYFDNPKGSIPKTVVNFAVKQSLPKMLDQLKTCLGGYADYKAKRDQK